MTNCKRLIGLILVLLVATIQLNAQKVSKKERIDSVLVVRYWKAKVDTNYITRPQTKWMLLGRINMSGAIIKTEGQDPAGNFESELRSDYKTTLSVGASYFGILINLSLNPAKLMGKYHDIEFYIQSYKPRMGFDISYQDANSYKGWYKLNGVQHDIVLNNDKFKLRTLNVNAYYVLNYKRFSYAAAFAYNYIQRRSAGSVILAASGQGQHGILNGDTMSMEFRMTNIGIGVGYGYNYVPTSQWLLHISALPTFIVYSNTSIAFGETDTELKYRFPEVIITARAAIIKQIKKRRFIGFSMVYYFTNIGDKDNLAVINEKWLARLYYGFRL